MQVTGKVVTQTHGKGQGNGAWPRPVRTVGRKVALFGGTLCFSSQEANGIVRKDSPFEGHNTVLHHGMENGTLRRHNTALFRPTVFCFTVFS
jgi:hypothetical protein